MNELAELTKKGITNSGDIYDKIYENYITLRLDDLLNAFNEFSKITQDEKIVKDFLKIDNNVNPLEIYIKSSLIIQHRKNEQKKKN